MHAEAQRQDQRVLAQLTDNNISDDSLQDGRELGCVIAAARERLIPQIWRRQSRYAGGRSLALGLRSAPIVRDAYLLN